MAGLNVVFLSFSVAGHSVRAWVIDSGVVQNLQAFSENKPRFVHFRLFRTTLWVSRSWEIPVTAKLGSVAVM